MKTILLLLLLSEIVYAQQDKKETVYLLFNEKSIEKCIVEDGSGNSKNLKKYRKDTKKNKTIFRICDEKFLFNTKEQKIDTCTIESLKSIKLNTLDYIKERYQKGEDFKHHLFEKLFILEKISEEKVLKYDVYWCCEWIIE